MGRLRGACQLHESIGPLTCALPAHSAAAAQLEEVIIIVVDERGSSWRCRCWHGWLGTMHIPKHVEGISACPDGRSCSWDMHCWLAGCCCCR